MERQHTDDGACHPTSWRATTVGHTFVGLVTGTFALGWAAGILVVLKSWHLFHAPRWLMVSGAGYVTFMLVPIVCGFGFTWLSSRLVSRGWGSVGLGFFALGVCGLIAGLMAI